MVSSEDWHCLEKRKCFESTYQTTLWRPFHLVFRPFCLSAKISALFFVQSWHLCMKSYLKYYNSATLDRYHKLQLSLLQLALCDKIQVIHKLGGSRWFKSTPFLGLPRFYAPRSLTRQAGANAWVMRPLKSRSVGLLCAFRGESAFSHFNWHNFFTCFMNSFLTKL